MPYNPRWWQGLAWLKCLVTGHTYDVTWGEAERAGHWFECTRCGAREQSGQKPLPPKGWVKG